MASPVGLEPTTNSLEGYCSIQLSYEEIIRGVTTTTACLERVSRGLNQTHIYVQTHYHTCLAKASFPAMKGQRTLGLNVHLPAYVPHYWV